MKRTIIRLSILVILLACNGCVTAPNSNQSITINLLSSHSRYGQAIGGTNNANTVKNDGGGGNGAHASVTP